MDKPERWQGWPGPHTVDARSVPARCRAAAADGREGRCWAVAEPALSFAGLLRQLRAEAAADPGGAGRGGEREPAVGQ